MTMIRSPRVLVALVVVAFGLVLVPFVQLPAEGLTWQRYAGLYPYGSSGRLFIPVIYGPSSGN